jgi:hypothetical protein
VPDPVVAHVIGTIALLGAALLVVAAVTVAQQVNYMQTLNLMLAEAAESCARELVELVSAHTLGGGRVTYMVLTLPSSLAGQPYNLSIANRGDNVIEVRAQLQLYRQVRVVVTPNFGRGPVYAVSGTVELGGLVLSDRVLLPTPQGRRAMLVAVNQGNAVLVGFATQLGPLEEQGPPSFKLVNWTTQVAGPANSKQLFAFAVWNRGGRGSVRVAVYSGGGILVNSTVLAIGASEVARGSMLLRLPGTPGTYTWEVRCENLDTGAVDDSQAVQVKVTAPKITILSYTSSVSGQPGSQASVSVTVGNVGDAPGTALAQIQEVGAGCSVPVPAGGSGSCSIPVALPSTPGSYTWTLVVQTQETGYVEQRQVSVFVQQPGAVLSIAWWNSTVVGAVGQQVKLSVLVENGGSSSVQAVVKVSDSGGSVLASGSASVPAASRAWVNLTVQLPTTKGVYTWYVEVYRQGQSLPDDRKTVAVEARDLALAQRTAFYYTAFNAAPSGWSARGGSWVVASGVLTGSDDNKGPGGTYRKGTRYVSVYYWGQSVWSYADPASGFGAVAKISLDANRVYRGFAVLAPSLSELYEVSVYRLGSRCQVFVRKLAGGAWSDVYASSPVSCGSGWYTLYLGFALQPGARIAYALYDSSGNPVIPPYEWSGAAEVQPSYLAFLVDEGSASFDDLVVAAGDPRYVVVAGLPQGWSAELYSGGALVASASADSTGTAKLLVAGNQIVSGATLVLKDAGGRQVLSKSFNLVLGGDVYSFLP